MLSVIIPFHDEEDIVFNVADVSYYLKIKRIRHEIIVVDDCSSSDGWSKVWEAFNGKLHIKLLRNKKNLGKGASVLRGVSVASGDWIAIMDADMQIRPREISTFIRLAKIYDADAVIGDKRHESSCVSYTPLRRVVSNFYNLLTRILFGFSLRDTQCGFKLIKAKMFPKRLMLKGYAFDVEVIALVRAFGGKIISCPVTVRRGIRGSVSLKSIVKTFWETIWLRFRLSSRITEEMSRNS